MCPLVIIGDMQVIAPTSFVRMKGVALDDHNDKWDEILIQSDINGGYLSS